MTTASSATAVNDASQMLPIESVDQYFVGMTLPRAIGVEFSKDGLHCVSVHEDHSLRWVDVLSLQHRETIHIIGSPAASQEPRTGVSRITFTQSSDRLWMAPSNLSDHNLYICSATQGAITAAYAVSGDLGSHDGGDPLPPSRPPFACGNHPRQSGYFPSMATSPTSDMMAAIYSPEDRLVLMHPLVSAAVASTPCHQEQHDALRHKNHVAWSSDGGKIAVAAAASTCIYDVRQLHRGPLHTIDHSMVFTKSSADRQACVGVDFHPGGEGLLLMTSRLGEVCVVDPQLNGVATRSPVLATCFHGHAQRHFGPEAHPAIAARYASPACRSSLVTQVGSSLVGGGRHLLFYDGFDGLVRGESERACQLRYTVQLRETEHPRAVATHPSLNLIAVAGKSVQWLVLNQTI